MSPHASTARPPRASALAAPQTSAFRPPRTDPSPAPSASASGVRRFSAALDRPRAARRALLALALLALSAGPTGATEIVNQAGGYRLAVPRGWEAYNKGENVELLDPAGPVKKGGLARGTARLWVRPVRDPNFWFEQLLNRDETRDVHRVPAREGADARFDYVDVMSRGETPHDVSIVCRQKGERWLCVVLEYRVDEATPSSYRALQTQVLESLRPLEAK